MIRMWDVFSNLQPRVPQSTIDSLTRHYVNELYRDKVLHHNEWVDRWNLLIRDYNDLVKLNCVIAEERDQAINDYNTLLGNAKQIEPSYRALENEVAQLKSALAEAQTRLRHLERSATHQNVTLNSRKFEISLRRHWLATAPLPVVSLSGRDRIILDLKFTLLANRTMQNQYQKAGVADLGGNTKQTASLENAYSAIARGAELETVYTQVTKIIEDKPVSDLPLANAQTKIDNDRLGICEDWAQMREFDPLKPPASKKADGSSVFSPD